MNTKLILTHLRSCSDRMDKAEEDGLRKQNAVMQDFLIWLKGYLEGIDEQNATAMKIMVDTFTKDKKKHPPA